MVIPTKENIKEKIFNLIQTFLKNPPLIIWGSGATIQFGLPSMLDLNKALKEKINGFDTKNDNLEIELGKEKYKSQMEEIKKIIWNQINNADTTVLKKIISSYNNEFDGIKLMIEKFIDTHPEVVNIVTTNYDRVLEYVLSYHNFKYTDGFNGKALSLFDEMEFKNKHIVNLVKVHGSLNWFDIDGEVRFLHSCSNMESPKIIVPSKNKYQEAYNSPYRELIQKADDLIKNAPSFLVVGFGFNDEHLTPKIKANVKNGTPIVLITKKISDSSFEELKNAEKYIFFEKIDNEKTRVVYKESSTTNKVDYELDGNYWQLNSFMEIL